MIRGACRSLVRSCFGEARADAGDCVESPRFVAAVLQALITEDHLGTFDLAGGEACFARARTRVRGVIV